LQILSPQTVGKKKEEDGPQTSNTEQTWIRECLDQWHATHGPIKTQPLGYKEKPGIDSIEIVIVNNL